MELFTLQYVLAVAEYRKFSLAAQACYIGQPALSQQIAKLEKELGVTLFVRNAHTVTLTEPGKEFVLRAKEILQSVSALQAEMNRFAGLRKGKLNVGVITSLQCINFGGMLSTFFTRYPGIDMNIVQSGTYDLIKQLNEHSLDVAFMNRPVSRLPSTLQFHKLGEDRYSLAVPKTHPLSRREYRPARLPLSSAATPAGTPALSRTSSATPKIPPSGSTWCREDSVLRSCRPRSSSTTASTTSPR